MFEAGTNESMEALLAEVTMADSVAKAKREQAEEMKNAKTAFDSYWAGSAWNTARLYVKNGAVRTVRV